MNSSLKKKFLDKFHFKKSEIVYSSLFAILILGILLSCSPLKRSKIEFISESFTNVVRETENKEVAIYFSKDASDSSSLLNSQINIFNKYNSSNELLNCYRKYAFGNIDDSKIIGSIKEFRASKTSILMTAWSTYYKDKDTQINKLMAGIGVEGHNAGPIDGRYNFCFITDKDADYLISTSGGKYHTHDDLINTEITFETRSKTSSMMIDSQKFYIRDIIISNVLDSQSIQNRFGNFIVAYYLPVYKLMDTSCTYVFGIDSIRNSSLIEEIINTYNYADYSINFINNGLNQKQCKALSSLLIDIGKCQQIQDYSLVVTIPYMCLCFVYIFVFFSYIEKNKEVRLSLTAICILEFSLIYILFKILSLCNIPFFVQCFTVTGLMLATFLIIMLVLAFAISHLDESSFKNTQRKFGRKYNHESTNK